MHLIKNEDEAKTSIEYFFINLPQSLTKCPTLFTKTLLATENYDYFETTAVQTIIKYKWEKYTRNFFVSQFQIFLIFFFANLSDIYYSLLTKELDNDSFIIKDERMIEVCIALKSVCSLVLVYFMYYEFSNLKSIRIHF